MNTIINSSLPINEPILNYEPGSQERKDLLNEIQKKRNIYQKIPMVINGHFIETEELIEITPPYDHQHPIGAYYYAGDEDIEYAINTAIDVSATWANTDMHTRAGIFLKAADLIATKYRAKINAATILAQSKNAYQAEIDAACELVDFLRFNVHYMYQIYAHQPISTTGQRNTLDYRPLEGFVLAITPFNFTAISGNLPTAPALMGNTVIWKPSGTQVYSAFVIMEILMEAGLPDGVINMVYCDGPELSDIALKHPYFAGLHFTGSTNTFNYFWKTIGQNIDRYKTYPRIVGETGGKDFVIAHSSADPKVVATALVRGAFEYQGQKCSAASRAYISSDIWESVWQEMDIMLKEIKVGSPENFENFVNAVIDRRAYDKIIAYIEKARSLSYNQIIAGGTYDDKIGYFIQPTVILTQNPDSITMTEEIFGPVLTIYVYPQNEFVEILEKANETSAYALTGAIIANDSLVVEQAKRILRNAAGNLYINDKPTGAVVGQQPFGGARKSGTNDKAGSYMNLLRWVSPRNIKENFLSPTDYKYPFLKE
ncbi:MAG: L-glutamate gamma-semialdehyde dehydrogenase [Chitinophagales bacterium]|nr:L-glutamate gamma-semialdehyde dehydrogenase [Chitinophagales bacterium]MCZ2394788.1 L-glutamate gamma-semialdehyde dehydrogenase [Chitinophagales bacterium]